jgi:hypothetical protein
MTIHPTDCGPAVAEAVHVAAAQAMLAAAAILTGRGGHLPHQTKKVG